MSLNLTKTVSLGSSQAGLVGTIGVTLLNPDGTVHTARNVASIYEIGGGCYGKDIIFPDNWLGSIMWDTGGGSPVYAVEEYSHPVSVGEIRAEMDANSSRLADIEADTTGIAGDAMRGTNSAATETKQDIIDANVDSTLTGVGDIQTRLPAAMVDGRISSNVAAISGSTDAAANLRASAETIALGEAVAGTLSTTEMTSDLTITVKDQLNGRILIFLADTATAALRRQATNITSSEITGGKLTFTALTTAPSAGDFFCIV